MLDPSRRPQTLIFIHVLYVFIDFNEDEIRIWDATTPRCRNTGKLYAESRGKKRKSEGMGWDVMPCDVVWCHVMGGCPWWTGLDLI